MWLEEKKRNKKISISNRSNHRSNHSNHKVNRERKNFYSVRRKEKVFLKQIVFEQLNLPPPICRKPRGSILKLLPAKKNKKKIKKKEVFANDNGRNKKLQKCTV